MFDVMSLKDLAKELGVPTSTIRTWKLCGDIPEDCFKKNWRKSLYKNSKI